MKKAILLVLMLVISGCSIWHKHKAFWTKQRSKDKVSTIKQATISIKSDLTQKDYMSAKKRLKPVVNIMPNSPVYTVSLSPDGKYIISGGQDERIKIWNIDKGSLIYTLKGHDGPIFSVSFSPDGKLIASGSLDQTIKIWKIGRDKPVRTLEGHKSWVKSVVFSPKGEYIASGSLDQTIKIWKIGIGRLVRTLKGHKDSLLSVSFSPDGKYIASGSADHSIKIWKTGTGRLARTLKGHKDWVLSVSFSPDGRYIASGSKDTSIKIWETGTGRLVRTLKGHKDWVLSVSFSPDGRYIASGSADHSIKIWETDTGRLIHTLKGNKGSVLSVCFSQDGRYIVSGGWDGSVRIWDVKSGRQLLSLWDFHDATLALKPDGRFWGKGNYYKYLSFVDEKTGKIYSSKELAPCFEKTFKPPYLQIIGVRLYDEDKDRILSAGEKAILRFKIKNKGKGAAYDLVVRITSPILKRSIMIDQIRPSETKIIQVRFTVPTRVKTKNMKVKIGLCAGEFSPEPVFIRFTTKAAVPPRFKISYRIDDDTVGQSVGNGNGVIEPTETIELWIRVRNGGKGTARNVSLRLISDEVKVIKGVARIGNLPPGTDEEARFVFFVPAGIEKDRIRFSLSISEALGIFGTSAKLALNLKKAGGRFYDYAVPYKSEEKIYPSLIEVEPARKAKCIRANPNYYLFAAVVYNYDQLDDLPYIRNDLSILRNLATCYMGVPEENIKILENPGYAKLKIELQRFIKEIKRQDSILYFYYSGHGILDSKARFYLLPSDAFIDNEAVLKESGISIDDLKKWLSDTKCKKIAFIDACRVKPGWKVAELVFKEGGRLKDMALFFSAKQGQISNMDKQKRHSAFTCALYNMARSGLTNLDMNDDGYVEVRELIKPLTRWVRKVSASPNQTPEILGNKNIPVFPVK